MVSEDSDQFGSGLLAVHRLSDFGHFRKSGVRSVYAIVHHAYAHGELLEVALLRRVHWVLFEERNNRLDQIRATSHHVAKQMFGVVVVSPIGNHAAHPEESNEFS